MRRSRSQGIKYKKDGTPTLNQDKSMVAHLWANQTCDEAKCAHNLSFYNKDFKSYNSIVATIGEKEFVIQNEDEIETITKKYVLFDHSPYSNTTRDHIYLAKSASSHIQNRFDVQSFNVEGKDAYGHDTNKNMFYSKIEKYLSNLTTARKPEKYIEPAKEVYNRYKEYIEFFECGECDKIEEIIKICHKQDYIDYYLNKRERIKKEREENYQKALDLLVQQIIWFKTFDKEHPVNHLELKRYQNQRVWLRTRNNIVNTSKGITLTTEEAKDIYDKYVSGTLAGDKIQNFEVTNVDNEGITIGCHWIPTEEIEWLAKQLNW